MTKDLTSIYKLALIGFPIFITTLRTRRADYIKNWILELDQDNCPLSLLFSSPASLVTATDPTMKGMTDWRERAEKFGAQAR